MNLTELQRTFNSYAEENKVSLRISNIQTAQEMHGDECKPEYDKGTFIINDKISGIAWGQDNITGIELLGAIGDANVAVNIYFAVTILIDIFTGYDRYNRNKVLSKLGLNGKSFVNGREYVDRRYKFGVIPFGKFLKISISSI